MFDSYVTMSVLRQGSDTKGPAEEAGPFSLAQKAGPKDINVRKVESVPCILYGRSREGSESRRASYV